MTDPLGSNYDRLLFTSTQDRKIQKDIFLEIYLHTHPNKLPEATMHYHTFRQTAFTIQDSIRFYRQINQSSPYLTQVTFEDLPWFISYINRQTLKTEDRSNLQVQFRGSNFSQFQVQFPSLVLRSQFSIPSSKLRSKIVCPFPRKDFCNPSSPVIL